jgi:hypothetical protein
MKAILYDLLLIALGIMLISFRDFYATLGLPKAKSPEERTQQARTRMYQVKKWNSVIIGFGFLVLGSYWLYLNLTK